VAESDEANNALAGGAVTIRRPDLMVASVSVPPAGHAGGKVVIGNAVTNAGARTSQPFTVGIYLSTDATPGTGLLLASRRVSGLAAGATSSVSTTVTIPATTVSGAYSVSVVVDVNLEVPEGDEANNGLGGGTIVVGRPDLAVTAVSAPLAGDAGGRVSIPNTVANTGTAPAGPFKVGIYLSTSTTPGTGFLIGFRAVPGLAPGKVSPATTALTIPSNVPAGSYFVAAVVDFDSLVPEDGTDTAVANGLSTATQLTVGQSDLVVTFLSAPTSGSAGQTIVVKDTVRNQAAGRAIAGPFKVGFYLSATDPVPGAGTLIGSRIVAALAAGQSSPGTTTVTIPADTAPGTYFISVVADHEGVVAETSEGNNGASTAPKKITIGRPDLVVTEVIAPVIGAAGGRIAVSATVRNAGAAGTIAPSFRVGIYLSETDPTPGAGTLLGFGTVASLAAGRTAKVSLSLPLAASLAEGTYFVSAVADFENVVFEAGTDTAVANGLTATFTLAISRPDLVVIAVDGPAGVRAGGPARILAKVKMQGVPRTRSGPFRVGIYMSSTDATPGAGTLVGFRDVPALNAGASSIVTAVVTLPPGIVPGTYFVSARADILDAVLEGDEANNGLTSPQQIVVRP
jgi:subtilase family serine protease